MEAVGAAGREAERLIQLKAVPETQKVILTGGHTVYLRNSSQHGAVYGWAVQ